MERDEIVDVLPDWVGGRLGAERAWTVERAVAEDADLREEARVLRIVARARHPVPEGLADDIRSAVLEERRASSGWRAPTWALTWALGAAAALVLALGTWAVSERGRRDGIEESEAIAIVLESVSTPWVADDGTVAGAPVMDELTEEALTTLLEELGG